MIHGVGIDIIRIERLKRSAETLGQRFFERVFTPDEITYCCRRKDPYPSFSARFAAKEALIKAITTGMRIAPKEIEVVITDKGKPCINVIGRLREIFTAEGITAAHLSLSHEKDYAVAYVVLEKGDSKP